jgi:hypothetical protein
MRAEGAGATRHDPPVAGYLRFSGSSVHDITPRQSDRQRNSRRLVPVGTFPTFPDLNFGGYATRIIRAPPKEEIMESTLVRRDQFNITPQGIVHKPTAAAFTPYPGDPYSGITRMGQLGNKHPNGIGFSADDVQRMMRELWVEYVIGNPKLFETTWGVPIPERLNWPNPQIN